MVSTARLGELEVEEEEEGEVGGIEEKLECKEEIKRGKKRRIREKEKEKEKEKIRLRADHEGSVAAGPALAQPSQLHRQFGQPAHPLF